MRLIEFRDLLSAVLPAVYHYTAPETPPGTYLVWNEYSAGGTYADGRRVVKTQQIQLDLYTKTEFDPMLDNLELVLTDAGIAFSGPNTEYDPKTGYIHNQWDCEVIVCGTAKSNSPDG